MLLGRRPTPDDGLAPGMYFIKAATPQAKIQLLGMTMEAITYHIVSPPADAAANPNHLTMHRATFARQVSEGRWIEVAS